MYNSFRWLMFVLPWLFIGCDSNESPDSYQIQWVIAATPEPYLTKGRLDLGDLIIDNAVMGIKRLEIKRPEGQNEGNSLQDFENERVRGGTFQVNLLNGISQPSIPPATINGAIYNRVKLVTGVWIDDQFSIKVSGTLNEIPFIFTWNEEKELKMERSAALNLEPGIVNRVLVSYNFKNWFNKIDFDGATRTNNGTVIINRAFNVALFEAIKENMLTDGKLALDQNRDLIPD